MTEDQAAELIAAVQRIANTLTSINGNLQQINGQIANAASRIR